MQEESKRTPWKEKRLANTYLENLQLTFLTLSKPPWNPFSRGFRSSWTSSSLSVACSVDFFFVICFFCNSSSPIHSLLNLTICIFSLGDRWHWKVNHLSAQSQPQKIAVAKRGNTYTKPTEIKGEIQFVPGGYFTFLTLVFFCFLNKKPSAGCHGIRKKCDKRFVKVAEEGGLEEGHFWLKTSRVQKPQELM